MSNNLSGLLSATFVEPGYRHLVELVHQRDIDARRRLHSLDLAVWAADGKLLTEIPVDTDRETLDLAAAAGGPAAGRLRVMVTFDARYDERVFPYRPHHYAYLHREGSPSPPLYYAVNAALGGVPDRIDNTRINNFETYIYARRPFAELYSLVMGNVARFATNEAQVFAYYGPERVALDIALPPKAHAEVPLAQEHAGRRLDRVEVKSLFRLASYAVGRRSASGELVLFDHLFTYFR